MQLSCIILHLAWLAQLARACGFYYKYNENLKVTGSNPVSGLFFFFVFIVGRSASYIKITVFNIRTPADVEVNQSILH